MADEMKSGDESNIEGQAVRFYRPALFGEDFRRDPDGLRPMICSIMATSCFARRLPGCGGGRDFIRFFRSSIPIATMPLRWPTICWRCFGHGWIGSCAGIGQSGKQIHRPGAKEKLLGILAEEVVVGGQSGPLMVQLHRFAASLLRCYEGESQRLTMPEFAEKSAADSQPTGEFRGFRHE